MQNILKIKLVKYKMCLTEKCIQRQSSKHGKDRNHNYKLV